MKPLLTATSLYETDFYAWTQAQVALLRDRQWQAVDLPHLIEEVEALGRQQRQELRNRFGVLLGHLLKWDYQPSQRSRSWRSTIRVQRLDITDLLDDNPSLKPYLAEALAKGYRKGQILAASETGLPDRRFPAACPYTVEMVLDSDFWPGVESKIE